MLIAFALTPSACRNTTARTCVEGVCFELTGEVRALHADHKHNYRVVGRPGWLDVQSFAISPMTRDTLDEGASMLERRYRSIDAQQLHTSRTTLGAQPAVILDALRLYNGATYRRRTWLLVVDHRWLAIDVTAPDADFTATLAVFQQTIATLSIASPS